MFNFSYSPFYLSAGLEFLAMSKHELIPMCQRRAQELERQKNHAEKKIAVSQVANLTMLNDVSKDILATLSCSQVVSFQVSRISGNKPDSQYCDWSLNPAVNLIKAKTMLVSY